MNILETNTPQKSLEKKSFSENSIKKLSIRFGLIFSLALVGLNGKNSFASPSPEPVKQENTLKSSDNNSDKKILNFNPEFIQKYADKKNISLSDAETDFQLNSGYLNSKKLETRNFILPKNHPLRNRFQEWCRDKYQYFIVPSFENTRYQSAIALTFGDKIFVNSSSIKDSEHLKAVLANELTHKILEENTSFAHRDFENDFLNFSFENKNIPIENPPTSNLQANEFLSDEITLSVYPQDAYRIFLNYLFDKNHKGYQFSHEYLASYLKKNHPDLFEQSEIFKNKKDNIPDQSVLNIAKTTSSNLNKIEASDFNTFIIKFYLKFLISEFEKKKINIHKLKNYSLFGQSLFLQEKFKSAVDLNNFQKSFSLAGVEIANHLRENQR